MLRKLNDFVRSGCRRLRIVASGRNQTQPCTRQSGVHGAGSSRCSSRRKARRSAGQAAVRPTAGYHGPQASPGRGQDAEAARGRPDALECPRAGGDDGVAHHGSPIWKAHDLQPHRIETFKSARIRTPRTRSTTWSVSICTRGATPSCSVNEKTQIQALNRTQRILPPRPGLLLAQRDGQPVRNGVGDARPTSPPALRR